MTVPDPSQAFNIGVFSNTHWTDSELQRLKSAGLTFLIRPAPEQLQSELNLSIQNFGQYVCLLDVPLQDKKKPDTGQSPPKSANHHALFRSSSVLRAHGKPSPVSDGKGTEELYSNADGRQWALFPFVGKDEESKLAESAERFCAATRGSVWVTVPFFHPESKDAESKKEPKDYAVQYFQNLMEKTEYHARIYAALEISASLQDHPDRLEHWLSEPVDCVIFPPDIFLQNGGPVHIDPDYVMSVGKLVRRNRASVLLRHSADDGPALERLIGIIQVLKKEYEADLPWYRCSRWQNLYTTMEPLYQNLPVTAYTTFQTDVMKYVLYERALVEAMSHLRDARERKPQDVEFVIAVLGCGGGPLVERALNAAKELRTKVRVYAVDKNPISIGIVTERARSEWAEENVIVLSEDMRTWKPTESLDIIIHELLGCFADDECSPECLEIIPQFMAPDGISIPTKYTNFLTPISSTKLFGELKFWNKTRLFHFPKGFREYEVDVLRFGLSKPCITFTHVPRGKPETDGYKEKCTTRSVQLEFLAKTDGLLHGFMGDFVADLFGRVKMSTGLGRRTPELGSWGGIFFPLEKSVRVHEGDLISLEFHRRRSDLKVWYEWRLLKPEISCLHNPNGIHRSYKLYIEGTDKSVPKDPRPDAA